MPEGVDVIQPLPKDIARNISIGGENYQTNLPKGLNLFDDKASLPLRKQPLRPTELDKLPIGEFSVVGSEDVEDDMGATKKRELKRTITVFDSEHGKAIDAASFHEKWEVGKGASQLMGSLGFVVDTSSEDSQITAVPNPDTLKKAAQKLGVDIEYFPAEEGRIKGHKYLGAYKRRKYAVSLSNESDFRHDTEDDHLTAMVLGGEPLKDTLQAVATEALEKDDKVIDDTAQNIDGFTVTLRAVVAPHHELLGEDYGKEKGRHTLIEKGADIGISAEVVEKILRTAQENARKFGIEPKELL